MLDTEHVFRQRDHHSLHKQLNKHTGISELTLIRLYRSVAEFILGLMLA